MMPRYPSAYACNPHFTRVQFPLSQPRSIFDSGGYMSEMIHRFLSWYRLRLLPTVKRMLSPRRRALTGFVIGTLTVSAVILSLICGFYATLWGSARAMLSDFDELVTSAFASGIPSPALSELRGTLLTARADVLVSLVFALGLWLLLSLMAIRWVMKYVLDAESETYALHMIFGSDQKQLRIYRNL